MIPDQLHQATIHHLDDSCDQLFSADGLWFYRHWPPRADDRPYERNWLEEIAPAQSDVARVEIGDQEFTVEELTEP